MYLNFDPFYCILLNCNSSEANSTTSLMFNSQRFIQIKTMASHFYYCTSGISVFFTIYNALTLLPSQIFPTLAQQLSFTSSPTQVDVWNVSSHSLFTHSLALLHNYHAPFAFFPVALLISLSLRAWFHLLFLLRPRGALNLVSLNIFTLT